MIICDFPGCCKAKVLYRFGGGHVGQIENHTKQQVIEYVKNSLRSLKGRSALLFAVPTSAQPNAIAALEEMGFYSAPDYKTCSRIKSDRHKLIPFFIPLSEWNEKEFNKRYDPIKDTYKNKRNSGLAPNTQNIRIW